MLSQLHERLDHLVNYSSQLIFVSGDTVAQQHRNLESFLAQQDEHTEIAYVQLENEMEDADIRRQVCRQLVDTSVGTFVRPFNELLHTLNQYDGPVLICITQAQLMSDGILHELWDLVLQSRFANNKAHLNVILFAETIWAETAQQYLPARNSSQPLLLANESFSSSQDNQGSELERLIAAKREAFSQRLQDRERGSLFSGNVLRSPWFITLMVGLFCALFVSLIGMQYPEQVARFKQIFQSIEAHAITQPPADIQDNATIQNPAAVLTPTIAPAELAETAGLNAAALIAETTPKVTATIVTESPLIDNVPGLVMNWTEAQAQLQASKAELRAQVQAQADDVIVATTNVTDTGTRIPRVTDPVTSAIINTQAPSTATPTSLVSNTNAPTTVPNVNTTRATPTTASDVSTFPAVPAQQATLEDQLMIDSSVLFTLPNERFAIQIAGMSSAETLNNFIAQNGLTEQHWIYETQRYGGSWYVVLLNNDYSSIQEARRAVNSLPPEVQALSPFVKGIGAIKNEILLTDD